MANTNSPLGFVPMGNAGGAAPNFELLSSGFINISKSDTNKVFTGDPVKRLSTGYLAAWTAGTNTALLAGIFMGCEYYSTSQQKIIFSRYWPGADATNDPICRILPVTGAVAPRFWVQSNGTAFAFADLNINADADMGTAGNTTTGNSGAALNQSTIASTATLPFKIVELYSSYQNYGNGSDNTTSYNRAIVVANNAGLIGV